MRVLLIGQGVAGSVLAWVLHERGVEVTIADGRLAGASSPVAAGIVNPVTGKRYVKSWRFDEFFPVAQRVYTAIETEISTRVWYEQDIVRLLRGPEEANNWAARLGQNDYTDYLAELPDAGLWQSRIDPDFSAGCIRRAARVDFPTLMERTRAAWQERGCFLLESIEYEAVETLTQQYDAVIFCEGYRAKDNPFFPNLPWQIAKGEALRLKFADGQHPDTMLKRSAMLVPLGDGTCWAGGTYEWHYQHLDPSEAERQYLLNQLSEFVTAPFEIVGHHAGVRPAVRDRRPFLGASPLNAKVLIFNGLGTKGALLAPFWAEHLAEHLLSGQPIDPEVDVARAF